MSNIARERDYTKTKTYVVLDLSGRVFSAIALVILGYAGWSLQDQTAKAREALDKHDRQERRYLPMLRSLSVLELELEKASVYKRSLSDTQDRTSTRSVEQASYDAGTELRFVAESVFLPDGDPLVPLRPPDTITEHGQGHHRSLMPLRAAAIMYAELMRMQLFYQGVAESVTVQLDPEGRYLLIRPSLQDAMPGHLYVAPGSWPAWRAWLGGRTMALSRIRRLPMNLLLQDLRIESSVVIQGVLSQHVDLGDRYVQIRDEVERRMASAAGR
jgi:hypothetical protein